MAIINLGNMPQKHLVNWLTLAGILLALWIAVMQKGWVNSDATLYLEAARRFATNDPQGALALYNWPVFTWLIAQIHSITGLALENSARLMTVVSFGVTTWALLNLIKESGGTNHTILAGAWLLFSAPYIVGDVLPRIMRDQQCWAFYLLSLLYLSHFYKESRIAHVFLWQAFAIAATLFRVEFVSFLFLVPLSLLFRPNYAWQDNVRQFLLCYTIPAIVAAAILAMALILPAPEAHAKLGRLTEIYSSLELSYQHITYDFSSKAKLYGETVLGNRWLAEYAGIGLFLTLLAVIVGKIFGAARLPNILLAMGHHRLPAPEMQKDVRFVLLWAAGINLINMIVILLTAFLLTGRYAIGLAFIIIIFAASGLSGLYRAWRQSRLMMFWWGATLIISAYWLVGNLNADDPTHGFEQEAVAWVKQHIPGNAKVYYSTEPMRFYAHAPWGDLKYSWDSDWETFESAHSPYDILVLRVSHNSPEKKQQLSSSKNYKIIREFTAGNGDIVAVMVRNQPSFELRQ